MGFTRYWYHNRISRPTWELITQDCAKLIKAAEGQIKIVMVRGSSVSCPEINNKRIVFNGLGDEGCETFIFDRVPKDAYEGEPQGQRTGGVFNFCKTLSLPYDLLVASCLIVMRRYLGYEIEISPTRSSDWDKARAFTKAVLGYGEEFMPDEE